MYCYGSGAGYGRFIDRVEQPLFVPGQKGTDKSGTRKATSEKNETNGKQLKCYAIMATAQGGVRPAMVLTDERDAYDMCAALEAAGAVLTEKVSYEVAETILRH